MYCPRCGTEYVATAKFCSDCGVELVAERPDLPGPEYVDWRPVIETRNDGMISVAESVLQSAGIDYVVQNVGSQNAYRVDPLRLMVKAVDLQHASDILKALDSADDT